MGDVVRGTREKQGDGKRREWPATVTNPGETRFLAFTLIELLVVVSIISLLIAIVVPSLRGARRRAKETVCKTNLRSTYLAQTMLLETAKVFHPLNNEPGDGKWQYNYIIYDGRDYKSNFGPLVQDTKLLPNVKLLYCPFQTSPFHRQDTEDNPWWPEEGYDTRASYARRHLLTGRPLSDFKKTIAVFADVLHMPEVIRLGHERGVNAVFTDGHVNWAADQGIFTNNDLGEPFTEFGNPIVDEIWKAIDRQQ